MFPTQSKDQYGERYRRKAHNFESYSIYTKDAQYGKRHKPEYRHGKKKMERGVYPAKRSPFLFRITTCYFKEYEIEFS